MDISFILTAAFIAVVVIFFIIITRRALLNKSKIITQGVDVPAIPLRTHSESSSSNMSNNADGSPGNRRITYYYALFSYEVEGQTYTAKSAPETRLRDAEDLLNKSGVKVRYLPENPKIGMVVVPGSPYENMNK